MQTRADLNTLMNLHFIAQSYVFKKLESSDVNMKRRKLYIL